MVKLGKKRAPASLLSKMIQHLYNPLKLEKIEKRAIMKFKALEGSEKILGKVGNTFKVGGKGVGILDALFLGLDLKDVWTNEDKNINDKLYDSGKKISGAVGGFLGGDAGFTAGMAIGTFLGGPIGSIIGGFAGTIAGSIFGNFIGEKFYENITSKIYNTIQFFSGNLGMFKTGGVEFSFPKQIPGFRNLFTFQHSHFIAFEYEDFDLKQIIDLVNSKFLINGIKVKNLNEIYDTILKEIAYGFLFKKLYLQFL